MIVKEIDVELAFQMQAQGDLIIDVREQHEWESGHATGATHHPKSQITTLKDTFKNNNQTLILMCQRGVRSKTVADYLADLGYQKLYSVKGGLTAWEDAKLPVTNNTTS